jgi:hypothetical protein
MMVKLKSHENPNVSKSNVKMVDALKVDDEATKVWRDCVVA